MLHIITVHFKDKWVDIQKKQLKKFISEDYKVYTRLGENYEKHKDKFDEAMNGSAHPSESYGLILNKLVIPNLVYGDKVLILDSDAFPIAPISNFLNEKLKEYQFIASHEPQHEWDVNCKTITSPFFMVFDAKDVLETDLPYYLSNIIKDSSGNWYGGLIQWIENNNYKYYATVRSNKVNLHPLYFGIYDDLIYHHWAGSREMITRPDRLRHRREGGDGFNGPELEKILEENHKISDNVFEQITNQCDIFMDYLMEKYDGETNDISI